MNPLGFVLPAASIGLGSILLKTQKRGFYPGASEQSNTGTEPAVTLKAPDPLVPQTTIEEVHHDELRITDHPIEEGATISDHAFMMPMEVIIRCAWSNSPASASGLLGKALGLAAALGGSTVGNIIALPQTIAGVGTVQSLLTGNQVNQIKQIYKNLLDLQTSRVPFDIFTGKRVYKNMLFKSLSVQTDYRTENALLVTAVCREVILVTTSEVTVPIKAGAEADASITGEAVDRGSIHLGKAAN